MNKIWIYETPGIPDRNFLRRENIAMTGAEIRALVISKLQLSLGNVVYDVGSGNGSVAVELALQCPKGQIYALEKDRAAQALMIENLVRFGIENVQIMPGDAVETIPFLPPTSRAFIGGSGRKVSKILDLIHNKLVTGGILVATSVSSETASEIYQFMLDHQYHRVEMITVNISHFDGSGNNASGEEASPIQIVSGAKGR